MGRIRKPEIAKPAPVEEHPEDRTTHLSRTAIGSRVIGAFAGANASRLAELVSTWADEDAHEALDQLREEFWGSGGPVSEQIEKSTPGKS